MGVVGMLAAGVEASVVPTETTGAEAFEVEDWYTGVLTETTGAEAFEVEDWYTGVLTETLMTGIVTVPGVVIV